MRRCKNWAHKIFSWKYLPIWRPFLPVFPGAQSVSFLISALNTFQGLLKVSSCSNSWFNPCRGRWQVPICSWEEKAVSDVVFRFSICMSVTESVCMRVCVCVCVQGGREEEETILSMSKGIIQFIGFLELQTVCYSWSLQCRGRNGLVWNEARGQGGGNPCQIAHPGPQTKPTESKPERESRGSTFVTSPPGASYALWSIPQIRWWRTSAGISSSLLSRSLFLQMISPTQWTKGAEAQDPIQLRHNKAAWTNMETTI